MHVQLSWYRISMKFLSKCAFSATEDCFNLANSADPGEISTFAAFHMCLHCLPKYLELKGIRYAKYFVEHGSFEMQIGRGYNGII